MNRIDSAPADHLLAGLLTIMWHYVREPGAEPRVGTAAVTPAAFEAQIDAIARHRTVVDWQAVAAALDGGPALPDRAALLTFDDGLVDHHREVLPRLRARGWPAVFFVIARRPGERLTVGHRVHVLLADRSVADLRRAILDRLPATDRRRFVAAQQQEVAAGFAPLDAFKRPIQRELADTVGPILSELIEERGDPETRVADALHLSAAHVADLRAEGMTIGGHGRRHLWLDSGPVEDVRAEIADSADWLAAWTRPLPFAYPYGGADRVARAVLAASEFVAAFEAAPKTARGRYELGRIDAEDPRFAAMVEDREAR